MKKILHVVCIMMLGAFLNNSISQCTFSNPGVKLNGTPYTDPVTGKCMISIDLYFDLESNPGGKYVFVHIWPSSLYPDFKYSGPPTTVNGALTNSIASFGFYHHTTSLYMLSSYPPDGGIPNFQYSGLVINKGASTLTGYDRFSISGIILESSESCSIPQSFTADAWESQSADAQNTHCFSKGLTFYANDPVVSGSLFCGTPRIYQFDIATINTAGMTADYGVYIDNGDLVYNKIDDNIQVNNGTATMDATNGYKFSSGIQGYPPYSDQKPYADRSLWVVVSSPSIPNEIYSRLDNLCIPLAIHLQSFTAARKNDAVLLKWTTSSEKDNKGFFIERKVSNENYWQRLGFVASNTNNGNSNVLVNYSYTDFNTLKGVSQYRLAGVSNNDEIDYSEIRLVKGTEQKNRITVFPNPSKSGDQLNIVLENTDGDAIAKLVNMNGVVLKEWADIGKSPATLQNLPSGIYILQVWIKGSNEMFNTKVVVAK